MDREEFERIKQEEKEHLRKIQELKRQLRRAEHLGRSNKALGDMNAALDMSEIETQLDSLQRKAIETEVRLEMAMESAGEKGEGPPVPSPEEEQEMRASALIAQLKSELREGPLAQDEKVSGGETEERPEGAAEESPQKTIGRSGSERAGEEGLPEKTIGRAGARRRS